MAEPFTDADVELVGRAFIANRSDSWYDAARAVLTALVEAGRLLPPGVVLTEELGHQFNKGGHIISCHREPCTNPPTHRRWVAEGPWEVTDDAA